MARISINNGASYIEIPQLSTRKSDIMHLWDLIVPMMDKEITDRLRGEITPCSEIEFLEAYLQMADNDLVIGRLQNTDYRE